LLLASQFRSSARFFWVVSYVFIALGIVKSMSLRPQWVGAIVLAGAVGLQLVEMSRMRADLRYANSAAESQSITESLWAPIVRAHRLVVLLPPTQCGGFRDLYSEIGRIAAESGVALHSVSAPRYNANAPQACRAVIRDVLERGLESEVLYIVDGGTMISFRQQPEVSRFCSEMEGRYLCTLQHHSLNLPPLPNAVPALWPSDMQPLKSSDISQFLGIGWSVPEEQGVWSMGYHSELVFRLPTYPQGASVRVKVKPFLAQGTQTISAFVNRGAVLSRVYTQSSPDDLVLPLETCDPANPVFRATFLVERPFSPLELGTSEDPRPLGLQLQEAELR
jgi:hypothetical protein